MRGSRSWTDCQKNVSGPEQGAGESMEMAERTQIIAVPGRALPPGRTLAKQPQQRHPGGAAHAAVGASRPGDQTVAWARDEIGKDEPGQAPHGPLLALFRGTFNTTSR